MIPFKPMLAFKFNGANIPFPCYVQPKLNGIRALWLPTLGHSTLFSRGRPKEDGKSWKDSVLPHIHASLQSAFPDICLDGELYCHGMSLQQINARVAVNRVDPHPDVLSISYNVFDIISPDIQADRITAMLDWQAGGYYDTLPGVTFVDTIHCSDASAGDRAHQLYRRLGYEGTMYRHASARYGFLDECGNQENRWNWLLKRKDWLDADCQVIACVEGEGQFRSLLGAFELRLPSGATFSAGSGLTVPQRRHFWEHRDALIGRYVRIKYEMLSDSGKPLKPTIDFVDFDTTL